MNHAGNARRDARNHVKIKFRVVAARNTLRELISDSHNASIRRVVTVSSPPPTHPRFCPELTKLTLRSMDSRKK